MIIVKCPWKVYVYNGLCYAKHNIIELQMVDEDGVYLECYPSDGEAESDDINE